MIAVTFTILAVILLLVLLTVLFCMRTAKKLLLSVSSRKALDVWPDQYKLPYENIYFKTEDGVLIKGWFIANPSSEKTIIFMHGWGMNRGDVFKDTYFLHDLGYNLMYFDFRSCGESGGKNGSIGYLELKDLQAALAFLKETRPFACASIGLYGLSVGGVAAICEAAQNPEIKCVVSEGAYYSFRRVVSRWVWVHYKVPNFPLVPLILHYIRRSLPVNPEQYSPKYNISKIAPRPVFIIHGRYDSAVPAAQAKMLFKRAGEAKEVWLVPGAKQNKCAEVGGFEYKQRLMDFYKQYL